MKFLAKVKQVFATLEAVGAVQRRGIGELRSRPGKIEGEAVVTCHKTGKKTTVSLSGGIPAVE